MPNKLEISSGPTALPDRIIIYGVGGVGKSTLATLAPKPIYVDADDGTGKLDVQRVKYGAGVVPPMLKDFYGTLDTLLNETHDRETLVIDTLDALEATLQAAVCRAEGHTCIEDFGYGKGSVYALDEWRKLLAKLSELRTKRHMAILMLAHSQILKFKNPEGEDYDRFSLKLEPRAGRLIYEWSDTVAFARFEDLAAKRDGQPRAKGVSTERRYLATVHHAAYDAKARESVPAEIDMDKHAWNKLNGR